MNAFVTGGTGFVGSHLTQALLNSPSYDQVTCLVRSEKKWLMGLNCNTVKGDLSDVKVLSEALEHTDILFHVAGLVKAPTRKELLLANVEATETLIRVARKSGVRDMVIISSLAAAGPSNGTALTERDPMNPVSNYGESKKLMEDMIHDIAEPDERIRIIRPPAVYGPRESDIYTYFKTFKKGLSPVIGDGNHPALSMVYIDDLIKGILQASRHDKPGVHTWFLGGPNDAYTWGQIADVTGIVMNRKAVQIKIKPEWATKIASLSEWSASLLGKYPVLNREKAKEMVHEWVCSSQKAKKELNYDPSVDLDEGIARTIHWYKKHNWL